MEEIPERDELRRIQREQERERRRIRDRERRQSMTQEQRERHLARRRRNYQLRRQRAAGNAQNQNVHAPLIPLIPPNPFTIESSVGEASTSDEFQGVTSTSLDSRVLNHGQETLDLGKEVSHEGSSLNMETLAYNMPRKLRLNQIRHLTRNVGSMVDCELKTNEDASIGDSGSTPRSLRLNSVKRLARSMHSPIKETQIQNNNLSHEGIQ